MSQLRLFKPEFDVVIIGSGPAGMYCAEQLLDSGMQSDRICVLDAGKKLTDRNCPPPQSYCAIADCSSDCDVLHGEGGPGFYVDCKLCIDPDAGAKYSLKSVPEYPALIEKLDRRAYEILRQSGFEAQRQDPGERNIGFYKRRFEKFGLKYHGYPVRTLGTDGARLLARRLSSILKAKGISIWYRHRLIDIDAVGDLFRLKIERSGLHELAVTTRIVVLALGRAGSQLVEALAEKYSLEMSTNPLDIGVRLEFPFSAGVDLLATGANPKIKAFRSSDHYAKTHCFCHGGAVISYRYQGIHLVDGHALHGHPGRNSNINLLYRYRFDESVDAGEVFRGIMRAVNESAGGKIVAQRLGGLLGTANSRSSLLEPSLPADRFKWDDISALLPSNAIEGIRELALKLGRAIPGMDDPGNIVYAPAAEWTMKRLHISSTMETPIVGLFVVGDCAGVSQGVLAAAASGTIAAAAIAERLS